MRTTLQVMATAEQIQQSLNAEKWDEALALVQRAFGLEGLTEDQRDYLRYQQAVLIDMKGQTEEALELFVKLRDKSPADLYLLRSVKVAAARLTEKTKVIYRENPDADVLRSHHRLLLSADYSPHWLTFAIAKQEAKRGNRAQAVRMAQELLELSPNDPDYLRDALDLAATLDDGQWVRRLTAQIRTLIQKRPYDLALLGLLPEG